MLYDQAQLLSAYTDLYSVTKDVYFKDVSEDIIRYVTKYLTDKNGGFLSAEDADSAPTSETTEKKGILFVDVFY